MFDMVKFAARAAADRKGVTALEYALIAAAVVAVVIVAYRAMFGKMSTFLGTVSFS